MKNIAIGIDDFKELMDKDCYFVDKTDLIRNLIDNADKAVLYTRPRRFGKTLNMSMIKYFFEDERNADGNKIDNSYLFRDLKIEKAGNKYINQQGKYPVISITFKETKTLEKEESYAEIIREISREYKRHSYILKIDLLNEEDEERFKSLCSQKTKINEFRGSLQFLSECLYKYYGRKSIILVDEYDVPLESAFKEGYYNEMTNFIRNLFSSAFKGNNYLEFGVITGCLRISRESIFTGMNNLLINSIVIEEGSDYFGFKEEEILELCRYYKIEDSIPVLKEWYNGYVFGKTNIYNPWDILNFVRRKIKTPGEKPKAYWSNLSGNSIIRDLLKRADEETIEEIEELIDGKTIKKLIHEDITYDEVYKNINNLWNFLFFTGYLKKAGEDEDGYTKLKIPNKEILDTFKYHIAEWINDGIKNIDRDVLIAAIINKEYEEVEDIINTVLSDSISYFDTLENFYHGFMLGILSGINGYKAQSNRESGKGRFDIALVPKKTRKPVIIFEFKIADKEKNLDKKADEALKQIDEMNYEEEFRKRLYKNIIKYGISFYKKRCYVKVKENEN